MKKAPTLLEAAQALITELKRELACWRMDFEPDYPGELPCPTECSEKESRISQMLIVLNSCEMGDLRRAIAKAEKAEGKAA